MDGIISTAAQTSQALTTLAQTTVQTNWFRRFVSLPLQAGSYDSSLGPWTLSYAVSQSNTNSNMIGTFGTLYLWRPSTGAKVTTIFDLVSPVNVAVTASGTAQTANAANVGTWTTFTPQNGDVLVIEIRAYNNQSMATAYTNTFFYDGTTEASATNIASFLSSAFDVGMFDGYAMPCSLSNDGMI